MVREWCKVEVCRRGGKVIRYSNTNEEERTRKQKKTRKLRHPRLGSIITSERFEAE